MARPHGHLSALHSAVIVLFALLAIALIGAGHDAALSFGRANAPSPTLRVAATRDVFAEVARAVGGDTVTVLPLLGVSANPSETLSVNESNASASDLILFGGSLVEPVIAETVLHIAPGKAVDVSRNAQLLVSSDGITAADPYFWMDADNLIAMVRTVRDAFAERDNANAERYRVNAAEYETRVRNVDVAYGETFDACRIKTFIQGGGPHFAYLARRYGFEYFAASQAADGTVRDLEGYAWTAKQKRVPFLFYASHEGSRVAETIARLSESGVIALDVYGFDPYGSRGSCDWARCMESNLERLARGMECVR